MANFKGSLEQTTDMLHYALREKIEKQLYYKLLDEAQDHLKIIAKQEAEKLVSKITSAKFLDRDKIELNIYFEGKKVD